MNNKFALLIGIDYVGDRYQLNGCVNDINNMNNLIKTVGFNNIKILKDRNNRDKKTYPYANNIISELKDICNNKNSHLYIHYAGHGIGVADDNGDEKDGKDECIVPLDYHKTLIKDDLIASVIKNLDKSSKLHIAFDCCHSGSICDLPYNFIPNGNTIVKTFEKDCTMNTYRNSGQIIMISGCLDNQTSKEVNWRQSEGAFTGSLRRYLMTTKNNNCYDMLIELNKTIRQKGVRNQIIKISTNFDMSVDDLKKIKFLD
jgi:hypothetical protein